MLCIIDTENLAMFKRKVIMENPIKCVPLLKVIYDGEKAKCPYCFNETISYRFVSENSIGYAQFKCESCGKEAHLSRVNFPANVETEKIY